MCYVFLITAGILLNLYFKMCFGRCVICFSSGCQYSCVRARLLLMESVGFVTSGMSHEPRHTGVHHLLLFYAGVLCEVYVANRVGYVRCLISTK